MGKWFYGRYFFLTERNHIYVYLHSLAVNTFNTDADKAQLDLTGDNEESQRFHAQIKKWDRKKKKMVNVDNVCIIWLLMNLYV